MDEKERVDFLKTIYEQHWLHARHLEAERHWFTTVSVAIVAGLLALLAGIGTAGALSPLDHFFLAAGIFILLISIVGYSLCLTWRAGFVAHTTLAKEILQDIGLKDYDAYGPGFERIKIAWGWFTAHNLYLFFYSVLASGGLYFMLEELISKCSLLFPWRWLFLLILPGIGISVAYWYNRREKGYRRDRGIKEHW